MGRLRRRPADDYLGQQRDRQRREQVLYFLTERQGPVAIPDLCDSFNWSPDEVTRHLGWLRRDGLVRKTGTGIYVAVPRWPPSVEAAMRADLADLADAVADLAKAAARIKAWLDERGIAPPHAEPDDDADEESDEYVPDDDENE